MRIIRSNYTLAYVSCLILLCISTVDLAYQYTAVARAQSGPDNAVISNLQSKIDDRNQTISNLEKEIVAYLKEIEGLSNQASSLSATIKSLQLTQKKLETDIKLTENRIAEKTLHIQQLGSQIADKQENIHGDRKIIARSLVTINEFDQISLPELLLSQGSLSESWDTLEDMTALQHSLAERIIGLENAKTNLENNKKATEKAKAELITLSKQLSDQKKIVVETTKENNQLLSVTKNNQANYTSLLATRQQQKEAFEREVDALEAELKIAIDPSRIPSTGSGVLRYPLSNIRITQYFGNTAFATKNPQIYKTGTHPGVDFAASIGTPVTASLSGVVTGAGNMDLAGGGRCRAYGKWIMVKHANGLSTLYAHLSLINVSMGQTVITGDVIGYSGNTGATTGPHLHFGVYATEGLRITNLSSSSYCSGVLYPLADPKAYLNPLSYL